MHVHIFEAGKSRGDRAVDVTHDVEHATLRIGGAQGLEVRVEGMADKPIAEIRIAGGVAELANLGGQVLAAGREVPAGQAVPLGPELLISVGGKELVFRAGPSMGGGVAAPGAPAAPGAAAGQPQLETPSAVAKGMLKEVYAALGVPEESPALVVYDQDGKVVNRVDLKPPQEEASIGRHPDNRVALYHQSVSKHHAVVLRDGLGFLLRDLGSRNGTTVNRERVSGQARLKSGDRIEIGAFLIRFVDPKQAVKELADSVPDLARIEQAQRVKVGAGGALDETADLGALKAADTAGGGDGGGDDAPAKQGLGGMIYVFIGVGVLVLIGLIAAILAVLSGG